jgi:nicotinamidase-related amidase
MRPVPLTAVLAALAVSSPAAPAAAPARPDPAADSARPVPAAADPAALVIIDVQNFYFPGGKVPLTGPVEASLRARALLEAFRARGWPVIHVLHLGQGQAAASPDGGPEPYRSHPNVMPRPGEPVLGKREANAFRDTELLATLRRLGATRLVIAGMQTHMCVEAATRAAADLGFEVTVVHDACATRPLAFGGVEVPAAQVHAAALAAMGSAYAKVVSAEELLATLPPAAPAR